MSKPSNLAIKVLARIVLFVVNWVVAAILARVAFLFSHTAGVVVFWVSGLFLTLAFIRGIIQRSKLERQTISD